MVAVGQLRHSVVRAGSVRLTPSYPEGSQGFARCALVDASSGSVHMGLGLCELEPCGHVDLHVHSFEESFYVLEGEPAIVVDGRAWQLVPGSGGILPVGVPHAWIGPEGAPARWLEMLSPQPRETGKPADTFFLGPVPDVEPGELDIRDPVLRHFFRLDEDQLVLEQQMTGSPVDAPNVSASMVTAVLAYSGITLKMLVDQRLDAQLSTMFMVEYQPGGVAQPHDHPLEEAYVILSGEVEALADGERYVLGAGDVFWTGVGCIHAFENTSDRPVRWLETQAPQPPARHSYRFDRDWDYLQVKLQSELAAAGAAYPGSIDGSPTP
jgi:quercetin dioxygenase-like cupin family protein